MEWMARWFFKLGAAVIALSLFKLSDYLNWWGGKASENINLLRLHD